MRHTQKHLGVLMTVSLNSKTIARLAVSIEAELASKHGPKISGKPLVDILGYASAASLRQAEKQGRVTVHLFTPEKRRGRWALTRDVAQWLAEQSLRGAGGN